MPRRPGIAFRGPFLGLNNQRHPRDLQAGEAADCDNVVTRDGHVTQRPGLVADTGAGCYGGGSLPDQLRSIGWFSSDRDFGVAVARDGVYLQRYSPDLFPAVWTKAVESRPLMEGSGAIEVYDQDVWVGGLNHNFVYRSRLDNVALDDCGMEPYYFAIHNPEVTNAGAGATGQGIWGTSISFWVSRYNAHTGIESNGLEVGTLTSLTQRQVTIALSNVDTTDLIGTATHIRIYQARQDGGGVPGLIAEVEFDEENETSFSYTLGAAANINENNGDATYDAGDDDTDYNYSPAVMNGIPPAAVDFVFHDARMFYAATDGRIYFSQSVNELQGSPESVAADSFRTVPRNETAVALIEYRDSIYVFTQRQVHRLSGSVNSLTNREVVNGVLADDILSDDIIEAVEGSAGCVSRDSVIEVETPGGGRVFYCGPDNVYRFDGVNSSPVTHGRVQQDYIDRAAGVDRNRITAAHHQALNLILFCFSADSGSAGDSSIMAYDYVRDVWVDWATFPIDSGNAARLGPVTTRRRLNKDSAEPLLLRQTASAGNGSSPFVFDQDVVADNGVNFAATWTGPLLDLGIPGREKRFEFLKAHYEYEPSGSVQVYARLNGDSSEQVPATPPAWPQNKFRKIDPLVRLGFRATTMQPVFVLAAGVRSRLVGYSIDGDYIGRR